MEPELNICVFCGARTGRDPRWVKLAEQVGKRLAERGYGLIYGGGGVGLMGSVARGALDAGGQVVGVIPHLLMAQEVGNFAVTRLERVETMAERKARMIELADGFLSLPGGLGTLDELFEVMTLRQIGFHQKPNGVLNADGYFDGLLSMLNGFVSHGFVGAGEVDNLIIETTLDPILDRIAAAHAVSHASD